MEEDKAAVTKAKRQVAKERICNKIVKSIEGKDVDEALWLVCNLFVLELKLAPIGSKDMKATLAGFSKLLIDMKKSNPSTEIDKQELLAELLQYMNGGAVDVIDN
jgi:hypothetical protein